MPNDIQPPRPFGPDEPIAPQPIVHNLAHTKLYRELKATFKRKRIPRELFKATVQQLKRAHYANPMLINWNNGRLSGCMHWATSIQGHDFWCDLDRAIETFPAPRDMW